MKPYITEPNFTFEPVSLQGAVLIDSETWDAIKHSLNNYHGNLPDDAKKKFFATLTLPNKILYISSRASEAERILRKITKMVDDNNL